MLRALPRSEEVRVSSSCVCPSIPLRSHWWTQWIFWEVSSWQRCCHFPSGERRLSEEEVNLTWKKEQPNKNHTISTNQVDLRSLLRFLLFHPVWGYAVYENKLKLEEKVVITRVKSACAGRNTAIALPCLMVWWSEHTQRCFCHPQALERSHHSTQ